MIVFKLLGMSEVYVQEQQDHITAKNFQTAMNAVCVSPKGYIMLLIVLSSGIYEVLRSKLWAE